MTRFAVTAQTWPVTVPPALVGVAGVLSGHGPIAVVGAGIAAGCVLAAAALVAVDVTFQRRRGEWTEIQPGELPARFRSGGGR